RSGSAPNTKAGAKATSGSQADLGVRIPINLPPAGGVHIAAAFAGYRASWTIPQENLKPGEYAQTLTPPKTPRASAPPPSQLKRQLGDRDAHVIAGHAPSSAIPSITIHYRIEAAPMSSQSSVQANGPGPK